MKKIELIGLLAFLIFGAIAPISASAGRWKNTEVSAAETTPPLTLQIGSRTFSVSMQDNAATQALLVSLPMTVTMKELNENEKYYDLPSSLPTDTQNVGGIHAGDLMLYGSDCLVLFYEDFNTSYQYTRLGSITDSTGLSEALGSGDVQVTFSLNSPQGQ